ncbi:hypothetical protein N656DRAFT_219921 [Canariomyces notabilis]|uniref:Uncharacterized protein n=1 Tax=Canariomyces notabilis TaxID=2074819 RepID=A0AAN6TKJ7_9PEZI|nr:hypothetical protein N656DRAFT_219921 [Canariomyces arenarius]
MPRKIKGLKKQLDSQLGLWFSPLQMQMLEKEIDTTFLKQQLNLNDPRLGNSVSQIVHNRFLDLLDACHEERDWMLDSCRMDNAVWNAARARVPWASDIPVPMFRTAVLAICEAAYRHFKNPRRYPDGTSQPYSKLAISALRFVHDMMVYEAHLYTESDWTPEHFGEFRGPIMLPNGRPSLDRNGKVITIPFVPARALPARNLLMLAGCKMSRQFEETKEEPGWIRDLRRV